MEINLILPRSLRVHYFQVLTQGNFSNSQRWESCLLARDACLGSPLPGRWPLAFSVSDKDSVPLALSEVAVTCGPIAPYVLVLSLLYGDLDAQTNVFGSPQGFFYVVRLPVSLRSPKGSSCRLRRDALGRILDSN